MSSTRTDAEGKPQLAARRSREWLVNLGVSVAAIAIFLAFCELVVFRFVWLASDVPSHDFKNGLVRYAPNQRGVWRVRDEIAAPYRINAQGWNSGLGDYRIERRPGIARIALVGDSYVEALQVPFNHSAGEDLAALLGTDAHPVEVYRFAISGAPMSQYLAMVEHEVVAYKPDWIIVQIVDNDFDESFNFVPGTYTSSFLKLRVVDGRVVGEIPPKAWTATYLDWLRQSAITRFFFYRWQIRPQFLLRELLPQAKAASLYDRYANTGEIERALADPAGDAAVTNYTFGRLDDVARAAGARLLLAMDGDRAALYDQYDSPAKPLHELVARAAGARGIPLVDLDPVFAADWQAHHRRFNPHSDGHWNEYGHEVVAQALAAGLRGAGWR